MSILRAFLMFFSAFVIQESKRKVFITTNTTEKDVGSRMVNLKIIGVKPLQTAFSALNFAHQGYQSIASPPHPPTPNPRKTVCQIALTVCRYPFIFLLDGERQCKSTVSCPGQGLNPDLSLIARPFNTLTIRPSASSLTVMNRLYISKLCMRIQGFISFPKRFNQPVSSGLD